MSTPETLLQTAFVFDTHGRILTTREPGSSPGPLFSLVRGKNATAWAVRADVASDLATELDRLACSEPPASDLAGGPVHAARYVALLTSHNPVVVRGPAFTFPIELPEAAGTVSIEDEKRLERHFHGWVAGEIDAGRAPVVAVVQSGHPVSVCFCARRSETAAEAGLETSTAFRGRGLAPMVTAAWAQAVL